MPKNAHFCRNQTVSTDPTQSATSPRPDPFQLSNHSLVEYATCISALNRLSGSSLEAPRKSTSSHTLAVPPYRDTLSATSYLLLYSLHSCKHPRRHCPSLISNSDYTAQSLTPIILPLALSTRSTAYHISNVVIHCRRWSPLRRTLDGTSATTLLLASTAYVPSFGISRPQWKTRSLLDDCAVRRWMVPAPASPREKTSGGYSRPLMLCQPPSSCTLSASCA